MQRVFHLSKPKTFFTIFNPSNCSLNVFAAKNSPVRLLVRDYQCLPPSKKASQCCLFLNFFLIINRSLSARPGSPVTLKCLFNAVILSRFSFCLNCRVDVALVVSGSVNDVSSTLLVSGVL